jgi:glycerol-3-phosphate acyltransferase PlsX
VLSSVPMSATSHDTLALVRERDDISSTVGVRAVRDGHADAFVSIGHTGATVAASVLGLGRLTGMGRPGLAVELPGANGPVVLVDCGAAPFATAHDLVRFAACGLAYAKARGTGEPTVGLLSIGSERGKGDRLRKNTDIQLEQHFAERYAGAVEGHDLLGGCPADVVVADGFTGNVAVKSMEGALRWSVAAMSAVYDDPGPAQGVLRTSHFLSGGVLLGVPGAVVVGHGASGRDEIVACIARAVQLLEAAVIDRLRGSLRDFSPLDARGEPESE